MQVRHHEQHSFFLHTLSCSRSENQLTASLDRIPNASCNTCLF
jgi:hypothetical protein